MQMGSRGVLCLFSQCLVADNWSYWTWALYVRFIYHVVMNNRMLSYDKSERTNIRRCFRLNLLSFLHVAAPCCVA